ncbi:helix-turn-helix domain-containing protein [Desulfovibrio sp. OttesenSCG-928-G15]|nr:helix-turn-helix domain-containing protein [Desulfovibrio sp. OttesenSCG-928-G15]
MSKTKAFLAENLKARRKDAGLSQEEFAEQVGISKAQISEIERGIANPTIGILEKIADYFRITVAELLNIDDVLNDPRRLKEHLAGHLDKLSTRQLQIILSLIRATKE